MVHVTCWSKCCNNLCCMDLFLSIWIMSYCLRFGMFLKIKRSLKSSPAHEKPTWPDLWILSAVDFFFRWEFFSKISRPPREKNMLTCYILGCPPSPDASGKWRFSSGFPTKNGIILVVTVTVRGPHPIYMYVYVYECVPFTWLDETFLAFFQGLSSWNIYYTYFMHTYIYIHVCWHWKYYYIYIHTYIHLLQVSLLKTRENGRLSSDTLRSTPF